MIVSHLVEELGVSSCKSLAYRPYLMQVLKGNLSRIRDGKCGVIDHEVPNRPHMRMMGGWGL